MTISETQADAKIEAAVKAYNSFGDRYLCEI